jgi:hypothetical protein
MLKVRTPDNWWTLLLPDGTTKTQQETRGKVTIYTIRLLDGYRFLFQAAIFDRDKNYETFPKILIAE